jgi:hypothetical protein
MRTIPVWIAVAALVIVLGCGERGHAATWNVSTVSQLTNAVNNAVSGDVILVQPGTYVIGSELWMNRNGVTLRGATGNPNDVFIRGAGLNNSGYARIPLHINADYITVENITSGECYWHAIQLSPGADYAVIRNCITRNAGEQHIKGSKFTVGGLIENTLMENTAVRLNDGGDRPDDYLGGIDLHGAVNWVFRDNIARNIIGVNGGGDAGIFLWNESANCLTERNVIIGMNKGIAYGNPYNGGTTYHMDGGIVRNNFVVNPNNSGGDLGMEFCFTRNVKVYHNTIYSDSATFFRSLQIYATAAIPTVNLQLANNIIRGNILSSNANGTWTNTGNIVGSSVAPNWFVDIASGNLHLTKLATTAIGQASLLADVPTDFDGQARPLDGAVDVGADEFLVTDIDGDGHCDVADLLILVDAFGTLLGDPAYDPDADFNSDGAVDVVDLLTLVYDFGL